MACHAPAPAMINIDDAIDALIRYFGFELDFYCDEDPCDNNEDPYSLGLQLYCPVA